MAETSPNRAVTHRIPVGGLLIKLAWALLALIHVPIFVAVAWRLAAGGATGGDASLGSLVALTGTLALFTLKAGGVRFLRLGSPAQTLLAFIIVTSLVHRGACERIVMDDLVAPTAIILVVTTGAAASSSRRVRESVRRWLGTIARALTALRSEAVALSVHLPIRDATRERRPQLEVVARNIPARAPPALRAERAR